MSKKNLLPATCWCGSLLSPAACCLPHIEGSSIPETAEQLMRSRYSAYVLQRTDYLQATWHVTTRPPQDMNDDGPGIKWTGLIVHAHESNDNEAIVSFTASCKVSGRLSRMHERSRFVHEDGRWWYVDGEIDG